jgi:hypothetical protein
MAAYTLKGIGAALTYDAPGFVNIKGTVDIPSLIADPTQLALAATPQSKLTAFSGFVQNDTLKIALIPAGFMAVQAAIGMRALENTTLDIGDSDGATVFFDDQSLNSASAKTVGTLAAVKVYNAASYVLVTFDQAVTYDTAIFDFGILGALIV